MKSKLTLLIFLMSMCFIFAQKDHQKKAEEYLNQKGEVNFNFKVNDVSELDRWTKQLSILNYDPSTKTVYAWANTNQFRNFLLNNIDFEVREKDNVVGVMDLLKPVTNLHKKKVHVL